MVGVSDRLARISQNTARMLPIKVPSGVEIDTKQVKLKAVEISYPSGIKPTYILILDEEKQELETAAETWSEISKRLTETAHLLKTGSDRLDEDILVSLTDAQNSLRLASNQVEVMTKGTIPEFIAELELQQQELKSAKIVITFLDAALLPVTVCLMGFALVWSINGMIIYSLVAGRSKSEINTRERSW
jgi:hypothetical protein